MTSFVRTVAAVGVVVGLGAGLLACSSSKESVGTTTTTIAATTTEQVTTTAPTSTTIATTTTEPAPVVPVYPLTGLPVVDPAIAVRPALVVKIDNNRRARPQSGLNAADIVFEEIVEVQTRFAAVFHSQGADPVGPIRSGRTQDIDLLGSFNRPLFMWSGGNANVTRAIEQSDLVNLSAQRGNVYRAAGFFRSNSRQSPYDLYASSSAAWTLAPADAGPPPPQFTYLAPGEAAAGAPSAGADLDMDGLKIEWRFDTASGTYLRSNGGVPHEDALSGPINTHNVIVMVVEYRASAADNRSPEAQTIGSGSVLVFTGGVLVQGTWSRADRLAPIALADEQGNPIALTPGRTWVELARANTTTAR